MSENKQPKSDDAVLSDQSKALSDSVVSGEIERVKLRLKMDKLEIRQAAIQDALKYGDKGIQLLFETLKSSQTDKELWWLVHDLLGQQFDSNIISQLESINKNENFKSYLIWGIINKGGHRKVLSKADLSGANLSKVNLIKAYLNEANLIGTNLTEANLKEAYLVGAKIDSSTQIHQKWRLVWEIVTYGAKDRYLACSDLSETNLSRANLSGANLSHSSLHRSNLMNANLSGADLNKAYLVDADLSGADLSGADLSRADLSQADLSGANLSRADLSRAELYKTNLSGADLSGADLSGADVNQIIVKKKDLTKANFGRLNLKPCDVYIEPLNDEKHVSFSIKKFS